MDDRPVKRKARSSRAFRHSMEAVSRWWHRRRAALGSAGIARLVLARLRRSASFTLIVASAIALAVFALVAVEPAGFVAEDASLAALLRDGSETRRAVRVDVIRSRVSQSEADDAVPTLIADSLAAIGTLRGPVERRVVLSPITADPYSPVQLVAVRDAGGAQLELSTGHRPAPCRVRVCQAVYLGNGETHGFSDIELRGLKLRVVGRGRLEQRSLGRPLGPLASDSSDAALFLVNGIKEVERVPALASVPRRFSWARRIATNEVRADTVTALLDDLARLRAELATSVPDLEVAAPDHLLASERESARAIARRLSVLSALSAAGLLGFALLVAAARRANVAEELERLRDAGARRHQIVGFLVVEPAGIAALGVLLGGSAALGAATLTGVLYEGDPTYLLGRSIVEPSIGLLLLGTWLAASFVLAGALGAPATGRRGWGVELVAIVMLALLLWQVDQRGALGPTELARLSAAPPEILLLPFLLALVTGLLAARLAGLGLPRLERRLSDRWVSFRLAVLSLTRSPSRTAMTAGFVAAELTLGLFATSHAAQLWRHIGDRAGYVAGSDLRVTETGPSDQTLDVLPLSRYHDIGAAQVLPGIRSEGSVASAATETGDRFGALTVLGLPARRLENLAAVESALGVAEASELARRLEPGRSLLLAGPAIPQDARTLRQSLSGPARLEHVGVPVQTPAGRFHRLVLIGKGRGRRVFEAAVPEGLRGARVLGVELSLPRSSHLSSTRDLVRLGPLIATRGAGRADVVTTFGDSDWMPDLGSRSRQLAGNRGVGVSYAPFAEPGTLGLYRRQPGGDGTVPALVSPDVASDAELIGGVLTIAMPGGESFALRPVKVAARFPTLRGRFVVADVARLSVALNARNPGAILPGEIWLTLRDERDETRMRAALAGRSFRVTKVISRAVLAHRDRRDPGVILSVGILAAAAGLALTIAVVGISLMLRTIMRDQSRELVDLEMLGLPPARLRRQLLAGAALAAAIGVAAGIVGAEAQSVAFSSAVSLDAAGRVPLPPLNESLAPGSVFGALAASAAVSAGWLVITVRRRFRATEAGRLDD